MKAIIIKKALLTASVLSLLGYVGSASAHDQAGALGAAAAATEYYKVTCYDDGAGPTASLSLQVIDLAPVAAPLVSVQVLKGILVKNTTDAVDGNAAYSPALSLAGGNGAYSVIVDKTAIGAETYSLQYHCLTSAGAHTGSLIAPLQNQ